MTAISLAIAYGVRIEIECHLATNTRLS